jgi:hypothetical protein
MGTTVFVFGAGATRGASFVNPTSGSCLPPLDRDFFTQLQRVRHSKHRSLVASVISDIVGLFGTNFDVTLETAFSTIEQITRMVAATRETRSFKVQNLQQMRRRLLLSLAAVFEEALMESGPGKKRIMKTCEHMRRFVVEVLREKDIILTFNYDCLIDYHLKKFGDGKWNARYGYGFRLGAGGGNLAGHDNWQPKKPADKEKTVRLLKLHGSLHFKVETPEDETYSVYLKARPYTYQGRGMRFTIIPPEYFKRFEKGLFRDIWYRAFRAVASAKNLVFVGYSLPATDAHATALFRAGVGKQQLEALVVANPDREVRQRIRATVQRGLSDRTRVLSMESFEEFVRVPREVWDQ